MSDEIIKPKTILSLDEARAAATEKAAHKESVLRGVKDLADKDFVLSQAALIATGVGERVYNMMGEQQAEALEKVEAMCLQHVNVLRAEIESRTWRGRWNRLRSWWRVRSAAKKMLRTFDAAVDHAGTE